MNTEVRPGAYAVSGINSRENNNSGHQSLSTFDNLGDASDQQIDTNNVDGGDSPDTNPVVVTAVLHEEYWRQPNNNSITNNAVDGSSQNIETITANAYTESNGGTAQPTIDQPQSTPATRLPFNATNQTNEADDEDDDHDDDDDDEKGQNYLKYFAIAFYIVAILLILIVGTIVFLSRNDNGGNHSENTGKNGVEKLGIAFQNILIDFHPFDVDGRLWKLLALETADLNYRYATTVESSQRQRRRRQQQGFAFSGDVTSNIDVVEGLNVDTTAQYKAYEWLAEDEVEYKPSDCNEALAGTGVFSTDDCIDFADRQTVLERYTFATMYYALDGGTGSWLNERNWLSHDEPVCNWYNFGSNICEELEVGTGNNEEEEEGEQQFPLSNRTVQLYSRVARFSLDRNNVMGSTPLEIGFLTHLTRLGLASNTITGTIPSSLAILSSMENILIANNDFSGTFPLYLTDLTKFIELKFNKNLFTGQIPTEIGLLTNLEELHLERNDFSGNMPWQICNLVYNGQLTSLRADCNEVSCTCCTECCVDDEDECTII